MDKKIIYTLAASQAKAAGQMIKALDPDNKGKDDIAGTLLDLGADVVIGFVNSDDKKLVKTVKSIRDACDNYLSQQGG